MVLYAVFPGTVTTHDGEVLNLTYNDLISLYNVEPEDCILTSSVPSRLLYRYILLKPRQDNVYPNTGDLEKLGDRIEWGPDFDGRKKYTMETNYDALYAERNAEEQP